MHKDNGSLDEQPTGILKKIKKSKRTVIISILLVVTLCAAAVYWGVSSIGTQKAMGKMENRPRLTWEIVKLYAMGNLGYQDLTRDYYYQITDSNTHLFTFPITDTQPKQFSLIMTFSDLGKEPLSAGLHDQDGNQTLDLNVKNLEIMMSMRRSVKSDASSAVKSTSITYQNAQYGFRFSLPESWKGYTIVTEKWEGWSTEESKNNAITETGPKFSIRHPKWTADKPRQDIPIMVFTQKQWESLQQEKFGIGAAPIGPSKLGSSSKYVFALPARYDFAVLEGYQEVQEIIKSSPLIAD